MTACAQHTTYQYGCHRCREVRDARAPLHRSGVSQAFVDSVHASNNALLLDAFMSTPSSAPCAPDPAPSTPAQSCDTSSGGGFSGGYDGGGGGGGCDGGGI